MTDTKELSGRTAVVTGSSSGIGEATARRLSALGASIVINSSTSVEAGSVVAESLPGPAIYVRADISEADDRERLLDQTIDRFGGIDLLVNNAAWTRVVEHSDLDGLTSEIFRRTIEVNVTGTWELTRAAIPLLRSSDDACVVTVTSIAGVRPMGSSIAYAMSKAALNHMTRLLARSHGPIRFNAVAPGLVTTPWTEDWDAMHATIRERSPLGRSATADDCAEAVLALVRNRYATGEIFVVDGGITQVM